MYWGWAHKPLILRANSRVNSRLASLLCL